MSLFCSNCGTQANEPGFCANCGTAVKDTAGGVPPSPAQQPQPNYGQPAQPSYGQAPQPNYGQNVGGNAQAGSTSAVTVESMKGGFQETVPFVKEYIKTPSTATESVVNSQNLPLAIALLLIYALSHVLVFNYGYSTVVDGGGFVDLSYSFVSVVIASILFAVAVVVLIGACCFATCHLCNGSADFKEILIAVCVNTIPLTMCQALFLLFAIMESGKLVIGIMFFQMILMMLIIVLISTEVFQCTYTSVASLALTACILVAAYGGFKASVECHKIILKSVEMNGTNVGTEMVKEFENGVDDMFDVFDSLF